MEINEFQLMSHKRTAKSKEYEKGNIDAEYFFIATAGEAGELMNKLKKSKRGDYEECGHSGMVEMFGNELDDVITYALLAMSELGLDAEATIMKKYEIVNQRLAKGGFKERV